MPTDKPLGGRGKKESYTTYIVRLPETLKPQVNQLLDNFHASRTKYVSGSIYQVPASILCELIIASQPEPHADQLWNYCPYPQYDEYEDYCNWSEEADIEWTAKELPQFNKLFPLADQVNLCLWQIDNTFGISDPLDVRTAIDLLTQYGLVEMDNYTSATSAKTLFDWVVEKQGCRTSYRDAILDAFEERRFDLLVALEVGKAAPVDRTAYWHKYYNDLLAKPKVNYWEWRNNPESKEICLELSHLLTLPAPCWDARRVLECLAEGKDPFYKIEPKGNTAYGLSFADFLKQGDLANCDPKHKKEYRRAFAAWHEEALSQLGQDMLERIYKVIYNVDFDLIESILITMSGEWFEILGVSDKASHAEVKAAYRRLATIWHPDVSPNPKAQEYMAIINRAFEQYRIKRCYTYK